MSTVAIVGCSMAGSGTRFKPSVPSTRHWGDAYDISMWSVYVTIMPSPINLGYVFYAKVKSSFHTMQMCIRFCCRHPSKNSITNPPVSVCENHHSD